MCHSFLLIYTILLISVVLDPSHKVYEVKSVAAIPLQEDRATTAVKAISSRNAILARPSLLPRGSTVNPVTGVAEEELDGELVDSPAVSTPRVQFSPEPEVKLVTPIHERFNGDELPRPASPQSIASGVSTPSSEHSLTTAPVFKTVAERLSFWNRLSKRKSVSTGDTPMDVPPPQTAAQEREALDKIMQDTREEPAEVIKAIVDSTAPPPVTAEERHSELEDKVIRECIRQFSKGGMYFSYTFGTMPDSCYIYHIIDNKPDVTRSLQHKQEQLAKSQKQHELLAGLGALPSPDADPSLMGPVPGTKVSTTVEPYPTLPLWRRVDKQFWWNEWMSKHFIDAGVCPY